MIAKIIPGSYDVEGTQTGQPRSRHAFVPTFPLASYLTQPLSIHCKDLEELRKFLVGCRYITDEKQFGHMEYWMLPEDFECKRQGDCEDFALWTWRQLLEMGYDSRFVGGYGNRNGRGHAWVTFRDGGEDYVLEPLWGRVGNRFPRLRILFLRPRMSVAWDGANLRYFQHEELHFVPNTKLLAALYCEATAYWLKVWARYIPWRAWRTLKSPVEVIHQVRAIAKRLTLAAQSPIIVYNKRLRGHRRK